MGKRGALYEERVNSQAYIPAGSTEERIGPPRALPMLGYRAWCVKESCSSWLGDTLGPNLPRVPVELCLRLVEDVEPELETIDGLVVVNGCSRRVVDWIALEFWVEVEAKDCFDTWASRSMSFELFSCRELCFSSLSFRLRSSSSFFASVLALEKPCRGAELVTPGRSLPAPVWERGTAISEDDEEDGVLLAFEESEREEGGETWPLEVSRLVRDGGKWLADIFGKEDDRVESRRISCKRVRSTPPSGFWEKVEREASPSRGTCWDCADVGGEASDISADLLTDKGLDRLVGIEPDRARPWSR